MKRITRQALIEIIPYWLAVGMLLYLVATARADVYARDFGFVADSPHNSGEGWDDQLAPELQAAIDYCRTTGDDTLVIDPGVYTVSRVTYYPGLVVEGHGATLAKRMPSHAYDVIFESYPRDDRGRRVPIIRRADGDAPGGRYSNTSTGQIAMTSDIDRRSYVWRGEGESPLTVFRDLTIRGDLEALETSQFDRYQREHSHGIVAAGGPTGRGRLQVLLEDVVFENHTGNGLYIRDADVRIERYEGFDCFRGVWSITRNASITAIDGRSFGRWGGVDVEPEDGPAGSVKIVDLITTHDVDIALLNDWEATLLDVVALDGPINLVTRFRNTVQIRGGSLDPGKGRIEIRTLGKRSRITVNGTDLHDAEILWIQRSGWRNVLDLRGATNVGKVTQAQAPRDDANILLGSREK